MPVTLQIVDQARWDADAQAQLDLVRIYHDAPQERMPAETVESFIDQHLSAEHCFGCAHFNDRLLGAVAMVKGEDSAWWLSDLCVRKTTRRRGVGSRLMALLAEWSMDQNNILRIETTTLPMADRMLVSKLGYRQVDASAKAPGVPAGSDYVELSLASSRQ